MAIKSKAEQLDIETFKSYVNQSTSCADLMRKIGYTCTTGNGSVAIRRYINQLGLDISHWDSTGATKRKIPVEEYFIKGNIARSTSSLKRKVLAENICEYKCSICGNTGFWNDKPLILQLHHIDGDRTNNSPENLTFLCPNCHSQTDSFAGKNSYD